MISVGRGLVGPENYAFLIAPSKENVFTEYYPHDRVGISMAVSFLQIGDSTIIDPTDVLRDRSTLLSYDKEETHWNDWGAYVAFRRIMDRFGVSTDQISSDQFEITDLPSSDLGTKLTPPIIGKTIRYVGDWRRNQKFHNGISNWGNITVYENQDAPLQKSLLFFGDSFGTKIMKFLSRHFKRAVFAHATSIDLGMIRKERPDYLINEVTDRFLPFFQSSPRDFIFNAMIKRKIMALPRGEQEPLIKRQREYFPGYDR